jgi:hypothetical protein
VRAQTYENARNEMSDDYVCKVCGHRAGDHAVSNICLVEGCNCKDDPYLEQLSLLTAERDALAKQVTALNTMHDIAIAERNAAWKKLEVATGTLRRIYHNIFDVDQTPSEFAEIALAEIEKEK